MDNKTGLKILLVTMLFPNSEEPAKTPFTLQLAQELSKYAQIKIIAPLRKFPMGRYLRGITRGQADIEKIPLFEKFKGIDVYHPKIFLPPKMLRFLHGWLYFLGVKDLVSRLVKESGVDLILSPYLYPDGFASVFLSKSLKKPVVLEARGCDVNLLTKYAVRRRLIKYACENADAIITVNGDLKNKLVKIGIQGDKISVVYNGVDSLNFTPADKNRCRLEMGLPLNKKIVLFVGSLEKVKGVFFLMESWRKLVDRFGQEIMLVLIGDGKEKRGLLRFVNKYQLNGYVLMAGTKPHSTIPQWINAADVFCLPSIREGCPNVLLEALNCNKFIVASNVGGIPEIIKPTCNCILVEPENIESLTEGLEKALGSELSKISDSARIIPPRSWSDSASERLALFNKICGR